MFCYACHHCTLKLFYILNKVCKISHTSLQMSSNGWGEPPSGGRITNFAIGWCESGKG